MKLKRFVAYIIDVLLVGFIASALASITYLNPYYDEYLESYDEYSSILEGIDEDNVFDVIKSNNFINEYRDVIRYGSYASGLSLVCYLLYFVGFQKWNKGQTLGKKLMKIRVVGVNDGVSFWQYLIRTLIVYNLLFNGLNVIFAWCFEENLFFTISIITSIIGYIVTYVCYGLILFRKDGMGLHDKLSKTKVVEDLCQ